MAITDINLLVSLKQYPEKAGAWLLSITTHGGTEQIWIDDCAGLPVLAGKHISIFMEKHGVPTQ